jgi:hypothetical protein
MKIDWGSGGIPPPFLTWALQLYPQGKSGQYPLNMRPCAAQSRYERCREEKKLSLAGSRILAVQPLALYYSY